MKPESAPAEMEPADAHAKQSGNDRRFARLLLLGALLASGSLAAAPLARSLFPLVPLVWTLFGLGLVLLSGVLWSSLRLRRLRIVPAQPPLARPESRELDFDAPWREEA